MLVICKDSPGYLLINFLITIQSFHIVTGSVQNKSTNNKAQLYHKDIRVQVFIAFND